MTFFDNITLAGSANMPALKIRHVFCGCIAPGCWKSSPPVNRLIYVFESGTESGWIRADDDSCQLLPHTWLFIPAFYEVRHEEYEGLKLISIHFNLELWSGIELFSECRRIVHGTAPEREADFMRCMSRSDDFASGIFLKSLIYLFLTNEILSKVPSMDHFREKYHVFSALLDVIHKDPCRNLTVPQMARIMNMGKDSFIKQFVSRTGTSPKLFFNRIRAAAAAEMLNDPDVRIRDAAFRFGFANEFYFSRFFKRHFGLSPAAYRNRHCCLPKPALLPP